MTLSLSDLALEQIASRLRLFLQYDDAGAVRAEDVSDLMAEVYRARRQEAHLIAMIHQMQQERRSYEGTIGAVGGSVRDGEDAPVPLPLRRSAPRQGEVRDRGRGDDAAGG